MPILNYEDREALGSVVSVDTATVIVRVTDVDRLRQLQVNRLVVLHSSRPGQHLVGIVQKIRRSSTEPTTETPADLDPLDEQASSELNLVRIILIGTLIDRLGMQENVFRRTLDTVPDIEANCFALEGQRLTDFMRVISNVAHEGQRLSLGHYTLDDTAEAFLNGNRFFQRHALIVGSTGSGKSWTTARILEQIAELPNASAIVFDVHGEYRSLQGGGVRHLRVAGPADLESGKSLADGILYLPFWLLPYEAMVSMFVDRSDQNAPNQAMTVSRAVREAKRQYLESGKHEEVLENFTIDSPVPYSLDAVQAELERLNSEMVEGKKAGTEKQGDFHGKLSRLISRLENKRSVRRLGFLFSTVEETNTFGWLEDLCRALLTGTRAQADRSGGVKIIDFSEVPSDVLPLIVSLVARIAFSAQQWTSSEKRHPLAFVCDEAHLYLPDRSVGDPSGEVSVRTFERIAKEGRKYGIGLIVVSQRPSDVNRTVLSQCNNIIAMRLTNTEDQNVVKRLLPDSLGGFGDFLPILDTGEALVVGDACLLPSRIRIDEPRMKPNSGTLDFWDRWSMVEVPDGIAEAVRCWRKQNFPVAETALT